MAERAKLVIIREYAPPPPKELAEVLSRVYQRLLSGAALTPRSAEARMTPNLEGGRRADEGSTIRES